MNTDTEKFIKSIVNFNATIKESGGSPFMMETLSNMSVLDLLDLISTNNIEFKYTGNSVKEAVPDEVRTPENANRPGVF